MKNIVYCADGTWDEQSKGTNVFKLFNSLVVSSKQIPFYDSGVGTDGSEVQKLLGGAFGDGLFQKIKDGYTKISSVYEEGDRLFIFGFSRGAYTARSLAGMISACGLPTKNYDDKLVESAFQAYRHKDQRVTILSGLKTEYAMAPAPITMVGVWDTVGSLGIPAVFGGIDIINYGFLDTSLNPNIQHAYHALAIDERRKAFPPALWTSEPCPGQTLEQVWFCGVHCDVGGGYPPSDPSGTSVLSDITLCWMMEKAAALGVQISLAALARYTSPPDAQFALDQVHESWSPMWGFPARRSIPGNSSLSNSVLIRCQHHDGYMPGSLALQSGIPASTYQILSVVGAPPTAVLSSADPSATIPPSAVEATTTSVTTQAAAAPQS